VGGRGVLRLSESGPKCVLRTTTFQLQTRTMTPSGGPPPRPPRSARRPAARRSGLPLRCRVQERAKMGGSIRCPDRPEAGLPRRRRRPGVRESGRSGPAEAASGDLHSNVRYLRGVSTTTYGGVVAGDGGLSASLTPGGGLRPPGRVAGARSLGTPELRHAPRATKYADLLVITRSRLSLRRCS